MTFASKCQLKCLPGFHEDGFSTSIRVMYDFQTELAKLEYGLSQMVQP